MIRFLPVIAIARSQTAPTPKGGDRHRRLKSYVAVAAISLSPPPPKCALYGGREFLVHPLELLGRIGADMVAGPRDVGPKL